jgi:protein-tyrosine phosphatase
MPGAGASDARVRLRTECAGKMPGMKPYAILFCCTGNICRSPTAEGVFAKKITDAGLTGRIRVDSAGTHGYHVGEPPDPRSQTIARARGYDLSGLRARRIGREDFDRFDLVLAMDHDNHAFLAQLCPPAYSHKLKLMMEYARSHSLREVPDPYEGGPEGFETVLEMLEDASEGLLQSLLDEQAVKR